jgi:hypothetical protein
MGNWEHVRACKQASVQACKHTSKQPTHSSTLLLPPPNEPTNHPPPTGDRSPGRHPHDGGVPGAAAGDAGVQGEHHRHLLARRPHPREVGECFALLCFVALWLCCLGLSCLVLSCLDLFACFALLCGVWGRGRREGAVYPQQHPTPPHHNHNTQYTPTHHHPRLSHTIHPSTPSLLQPGGRGAGAARGGGVRGHFPRLRALDGRGEEVHRQPRQGPGACRGGKSKGRKEAWHFLDGLDLCVGRQLSCRAVLCRCCCVAPR